MELDIRCMHLDVWNFGPGLEMKWCRVCGAVMVGNGEWRIPKTHKHLQLHISGLGIFIGEHKIGRTLPEWRRDKFEKFIDEAITDLTGYDVKGDQDGSDDR